MENVKLNFVIVCDNAFIAQGSNSLNIIGVFDRIGAQQFPVMFPRLYVVTNFSGTPGSYTQRIVFRAKKNDEIIAKLESSGIVIAGTGQKAQFIGSFFGLSFPEKDEYIIEVFINNVLQPLSATLYVG